MSPYDDGWLLDLLAVEIRLNDPRAISARAAIDRAVQALEVQATAPVVVSDPPRTNMR